MIIRGTVSFCWKLYDSDKFSSISNRHNWEYAFTKEHPRTFLDNLYTPEWSLYGSNAFKVNKS